MTEKTRTIAFLDGSDWYDASVNILDIPENMDLRAEKKLFLESKVGYESFIDWLKKRGATNCSSIEEMFVEDIQSED